MSRQSLSFSYYTLLDLTKKSLTESYTVIKSTVNPDVEVSSEISLSQNTCKEVMSRRTRNTYLASDTEAVITDKKKFRAPILIFCNWCSYKETL